MERPSEPSCKLNSTMVQLPDVTQRWARPWGRRQGVFVGDSVSIIKICWYKSHMKWKCIMSFFLCCVCWGFTHVYTCQRGIILWPSDKFVVWNSDLWHWLEHGINHKIPTDGPVRLLFYVFRCVYAPRHTLYMSIKVKSVVGLSNMDQIHDLYPGDMAIHNTDTGYFLIQSELNAQF